MESQQLHQNPHSLQCIPNILEVLLEDIGILKRESIFLYTDITIIPHSVICFIFLPHYQSLHPAFSNFVDKFSYLMSLFNTV